jgi:EmrB/QacA subfamily drug resistance transporter
MTDLVVSKGTLSGRPGPDGMASLPLTILLTGVAFFMVTLDSLVVVTALPSIHRSLGGDVATLQWTVSAYNMAFGAGIITAAALGDRVGRRRLFVIGLAVFTVASAACALAPDTAMLISARTVQGFGAAIITPLSLTILTSAFPSEQRGAVIGIWGGIAGLGVAAGPLIGGAVTQGLSWHWIFWVNVPVGILALIGSRFALTESYGPGSRLDVPALVLVAGAAVAVIWGLVEAGQKGWSSSGIVASLVGGACLLAAFVAWEARADEPMIPLSMFRNATFSAAVATSFFMTASVFSAAFLTSQFFQLAGGYTPLGTGLRLLPWTATPLLVAPAAGALSDRIGWRALMVPGLAMQAVGLAWIASIAGTGSGYSGYVIPFVIAGVGVSMVIPAASAAALSAVRPEQLGKASGISNTLQRFGAVFGIAIVTAVFDSKGSLASPVTITNGYRPALVVAAGFSAFGAVAALAVRKAKAVNVAPSIAGNRNERGSRTPPSLDAGRIPAGMSAPR